MPPTSPVRKKNQDGFGGRAELGWNKIARAMAQDEEGRARLLRDDARQRRNREGMAPEEEAQDRGEAAEAEDDLRPDAKKRGKKE